MRVLLLFIVCNVTPILLCYATTNSQTQTNDKGEVTVKSKSAKLQGQLPHGYSPISSETTQILSSEHLHPVIIVPDMKHASLEATVVKSKWSIPFCKNKWDYFDIWFKLRNFKPFLVECWASSFRLHYDPKGRKSYTTPGVNIRPKNYGSIHEIEKTTITPLQGVDKNYMRYLVEALVGLGYVKNQNLLASQYDWRLAPQDNPEFMAFTKKLVEVTFAMNGKKSIILTCHGTGCLYTHHFLTNAEPEWKVQYIKALIAVGSPWGGQFNALYTFMEKDDDVVAKTFPASRMAERTFSMTSFLLPNPHTFGSDVLIETVFRNYTSADYKDIFLGLGLPNGYNMWLDSIKQTQVLKHPEVDVFVVSGIGYKTMESVIFKRAIDLSDEKNTKRRARRKIVYGNGDGKVNLKSARRCLQWQESKFFKFHYTEFLAKHDNLVKETHPVSHILNIVSSLKFTP